jgi:AcrR family transcriptional regulator
MSNKKTFRHYSFKCLTLAIFDSNISNTMSVIAPLKEDLIQEQILVAAKRLFAVHGLHKVTMDDVAKAIGKGRSSLYYYYKSKDEIFDAVMAIEIREMMTAISVAVAQAATTEDKLQAFCSAKLPGIAR